MVCVDFPLFFFYFSPNNLRLFTLIYKPFVYLFFCVFKEIFLFSFKTKMKKKTKQMYQFNINK